MHSNCLATLANIAPYMDGIHPYAAHKLVKLFEMLSKKYKKVLDQVANTDPASLKEQDMEATNEGSNDFYSHMYTVRMT